MLWVRYDAMIKGRLTIVMEKDIRSYVKHANTDRDIWKNVEERFRKESEPHDYELKQSLTVMC